MSILLEVGFLYCTIRDNLILPLGNGVSDIGFKSTPHARARGVCIFCGVIQLFFALELTMGIVLTCVGDYLAGFGILLIIEAVISFTIYLVIQVCVMCYMKETEVLMDRNSKILTVKTKNSSYCSCVEEERKEFHLNEITNIEPLKDTICCNPNRVGFIVRLVSGENYTPTRASFTMLEVSQLQQFLYRYKAETGGSAGGAGGYPPAFAPLPPLVYQAPALYQYQPYPSQTQLYPPPQALPSQTQGLPQPPTQAQVQAQYSSPAPTTLPVNANTGASVGVGGGGAPSGYGSFPPAETRVSLPGAFEPYSPNIIQGSSSSGGGRIPNNASSQSVSLLDQQEYY